MHSAIGKPEFPEVDVDSIPRMVTWLETRLHDGVRTQCRGHVGNSAGFEVIALEAHHGGR